MEGLTPSQKNTVQKAFVAALKKTQPAIALTPSDARYGGTFAEVKIGSAKATIPMQRNQQTYGSTGSFI